MYVGDIWDFDSTTFFIDIVSHGLDFVQFLPISS